MLLTSIIWCLCFFVLYTYFVPKLVFIKLYTINTDKSVIITDTT